MDLDLQELFSGAVAVLAGAVGLLYREGRRANDRERKSWQKQIAELQLEASRERELLDQERSRASSEISAERSRRESAERRHLQDAVLFLSALARKRDARLDSLLPPEENFQEEQDTNPD